MMKISKRKLGILFIFLAFIFIETISFATYQTAVLGERENNNKIKYEIEMKQEEVILSQEEQETLDLINEYREQNGLTKLKPIANLQKVAKLKAEDLVNNNYFAHNSPKLGTPFELMESQGVEYKIAGENLAGNITAKKAVEAWINSKSHRENILEEKFDYTGICVIDSEVYGKIFVQVFIGI